MSVLGAFLVHEWRSQWRSLRFRVMAVAYVALSVAPCGLVRAYHEAVDPAPGIGAYAAILNEAQLVLTALVIYLLAADAVVREQDEGSLGVVGLNGLSNAGYILRRWLAITACVVPLTLVPPLLAAGLAWDAGLAPSPGHFALPWLLHTGPVAIVVAALAVGLGTIAGGTVAGVGVGTLALVFGLSMLNSALTRWHMQLTAPLDWLLADVRGMPVYRMRIFLKGWGDFSDISDAPFDAAALVHRNAPAALLSVALAACMLAGAAALLRRTVPDLRPLVVAPSHPLRTFIARFNRLRERYAPDPALGAPDRLLLITAVGLMVAALGYLQARHERYATRAAERYRTVMDDGPAPTPLGLRPRRARIAGRLEPDGTVDLVVTLTLANRGDVAAAHLAASLNPFLELEADAPDSEVTVTRSWDRTALDLQPPIAPGDERTLTLRLAGRPAEEHVNLPHASIFARRYESQFESAHASDLHDLSRSYTTPHATRRRVSLEPTDLVPVLRYGPWRSSDPRDRDALPPDPIQPRLEVELELEARGHGFLADACGSVATAAGDRLLLQSSCTLALGEVRVRGGALVPLDDDDGGARVAVLPGHEERARLHLPALAGAAALAARAWPEIDALGETVFLEWPAEFEPHPLRNHRGRRRRTTLADGSSGRLMLLPEATVTSEREIEAADVAGEALARMLLERRPVEGDEERFFGSLYHAIALARLGRAGDGAVMFGPRSRKHFQVVLATDGANLSSPWHRDSGSTLRLFALVADLTRRVGREVFLETLDGFLAGGPEPGSIDEWFERLASRSGRDLTAVRDDLVRGEKLPLVRLGKVDLERDGDVWIASGDVHNDGDAAAWCPVVLRTDLTPASVDLAVPAGGAASFTLKTRRPPRAVELDPDRRCFRYARSNRMKDGVDRFGLEGGSS